jgi:hypothetical protein
MADALSRGKFGRSAKKGGRVRLPRSLALKKKVFREEETVRNGAVCAVLKGAEAGMPVAELIRRGAGSLSRSFQLEEAVCHCLDSD